MDVALYTGNGGTQSITGLAFSPDLLWIKARSAGYSHLLADSVRGPLYTLQSDGTSAEQSYGCINSFDSAGFTVDLDGTIGANNNGTTFVGWCWDAGTSTVSNTQGSITSQVRANATAGFSVVTYTGTGSTASVGHGLGIAPAFYITKRRDSSSFGNWTVYHSSVGTQALELNSTGAAFSDSTRWPSAATSTVFNIGSNGNVNTSSGTYVAYCFSPVVGYSSFGSYTGNGSTDGPFVYTGFKVKWLMIKRTDSTSNWFMIDASRSPYNEVNDLLYAEQSLAETVDDTNNGVDFLSNGFKLRKGVGGTNISAATLIYAAFAEAPFNYSRAR
jgi:hypothetical protein